MKKIVALILMVILAALPLMVEAAGSLDTHFACAFLDIKFQCACTRTGTGAMISRYGMITAAHNLYCSTHGKPLEYCNFLFGAKSASSGRKRYEGHFTYRVYETFKNGYNSLNDIGYVVFESPIGNSTGWFAWRAANDSYLKNKFVTIMNYTNNARINSYYSTLSVRNNTQVTWSSVPAGGEGGPVFYQSADMEFPEVVAVYACTAADGSAVGCRITDQLYYDMKADGAFN